MAAPMAALQALNAVRAFADPAGFATYFGAPLALGGDLSWVYVYGARTAFIALLVSIFLLRRDLSALKWTAAAALLLPLGDLWIASEAGAPVTTLARHGAILVYIALTLAALHRGERHVGAAR
jgi:thiol:disulfide interchange protein